MEFFLQAADRKLPENLEIMLEDKEDDDELITNSTRIEEVVRSLITRDRTTDLRGDHRPLQASKVKVSSINLTSLIQPSMGISQQEELALAELIPGMRDFYLTL